MSKATDRAEAEQIREVIRLLNLALASCHESLAQVVHRLERPDEDSHRLRPIH